jgi:hypothetical protein
MKKACAFGTLMRSPSSSTHQCPCRAAGPSADARDIESVSPSFFGRDVSSLLADEVVSRGG